MKEQRVTADFMNLNVEDRGCQDVETRENCITNNYLSQLRLKCGCLPLRLNIDGKVGQSLSFNDNNVMQAPVCSGENLECAEEIKPSSKGCKIRCTGFFADVRKTELSQHYSQSFQTLLNSYENYKSFNATDTTVQSYLPGIETFHPSETNTNTVQTTGNTGATFNSLGFTSTASYSTGSPRTAESSSTI